MPDPISVFIAESLSPIDLYKRRLDGFAANEVLKIQSCKTDYRIAMTPNLLARSIKEAEDGNYRIFHLSCHGAADGIRLGDGTDIDWLSLAKMFRSYASPDRSLVMASCSGGHNDLTKALVKTGALFGYVFGSTHKDGVGFADSCLAWSVLYRDLLANRLNPSKLKETVNKINAVVPGDFVYRRWDGKVYRRHPVRPV